MKTSQCGAPPKKAVNLIRKCFAAYETKDRKALEEILSEDFTFTSPLDDRISRAHYFERCWPNSEKTKAFHLEKLSGNDREVFVRYECEQKDGSSFRNTEIFRIENGKIKEVDVYFGRNLITGEDKK